jgi:hypothetical protein
MEEIQTAWSSLRGRYGLGVPAFLAGALLSILTVINTLHEAMTSIPALIHTSHNIGFGQWVALLGGNLLAFVCSPWFANLLMAVGLILAFAKVRSNARQFPAALMEKTSGELAYILLESKTLLATTRYESGVHLQEGIRELESTFAYHDHDLHEPVRGIIERAIQHAQKVADLMVLAMDPPHNADMEKLVAEVTSAQRAFEKERSAFVDFWRPLHDPPL